MLRAMRSASKTWVMKAILGLLALTFVAFFGGVGGIGGSGPTTHRGGGNTGTNFNSIVQVGNIDIDSRTISTAFNQEVQAVSQVVGSPINIEQAIQLGLLNRAVSGVVTDAIYRQGAAELGVAVSDAQVATFIRAQPQFNSDAGFDAATYEGFLRQNGFSEGEFVAQLRQDLQRSQFLGTVQGATSAPFTLVDSINKYRNETRVFEGIVIGGIDVPAAGDPTEAQLAAYYDEVGNRYPTPEYRRATIVSLTPEQYAQQLTISEADLEREYDTRLSSLSIPEQRELSQVVFPTQAAAQAAADAIAGGGDFATVAEDSSGGPPVPLGQVTIDSLLPEMASAFDVAEGEVAGPVETPLGWHLIRADVVLEGETPSLDDVRDELIARVSLLRARDDIFEVMDAVEDSLAAGTALADAGNENGAIVREVVIDSSGTTTSGEPVEGLSGNGNPLVRTVFSTAPGAEPQLLEDDTGGFFAVAVADVIPPVPLPLEDIRDNLILDWQDERIQQAAQVKADAVIAAVTGGVPFAEAAAAQDLPVSFFEPTDRTGQGVADDLPPTLVADLFAAGQDEVRTAPTEGGIAIARVAEIRAPSGAGDLIELQTTMQQAIAQDVQIQLAEALRGDISIDIDQDALENLFTP